MKKILASVAVASVTGSVFISTAQAKNTVIQKDTKHEQTIDVVKYENQVTVNTNVLRVRTQPNTSSAIMGRVYEGEVLQVIGEENGWLKINHNGKVGYVSSQFVKDSGSNGSDNNNGKFQVASGDYKVNVSSLRVRTGPSTSHTILGSMYK
ncbi:SH3 domain-containing protein, partial [Bacillus cereus]|uniref:SH3 domain-containing protein n=1 Tax=Bacillus cereus TaxID=1396 RepID=UPI0018F2C435